jgi:hypothetical protein
MQCELYVENHQPKVVEMRPIVLTLFAAVLLPAAALAQTGPQTTGPQTTGPQTAGPQTAAAETSAAASPSASSGRSAADSRGITREQYVKRAENRASQRAGAQFDRMDADHDGVLERAEIRAWRSQHPRRSRGQPDEPASQ